jgi:hypothetical protein
VGSLVCIKAKPENARKAIINVNVFIVF